MNLQQPIQHGMAPAGRDSYWDDLGGAASTTVTNNKNEMNKFISNNELIDRKKHEQRKSSYEIELFNISNNDECMDE